MSDLNTQEQQQDEIALFCTGGAGIGIGKHFEPERGAKLPGYAPIFPVYMDTSKASSHDLPSENFYHLEKAPGEAADGSGGVRSEHGQTIIRYAKEMLQKFPPRKWNVVIHSSTGGSGSVMGPSIVSELLAMGQNVVVFIVGGNDTLNYIKNSISVQTGYETMVNLRERPIVLRFLQNGIDGTVEEVDAKIQQEISCLSVLFSGQNKNMDSRDIANVFDFSRKGVTTFAPQVAVLHIDHGDLVVGDRSIISLATLNDSLNNTRVSQPVEFQRVGVPLFIMEDSKLSKRPLRFPIHYAVTDGFLDVIMKDLRKQKADFELKASSRVIRNQLSTGNEKVASNGIVLDD